MKPLIVGEAPSKNEITERPIEGRIGRRLAACCDMSLDAFLAHFDRVNLLHVRQDTREKGFEFDGAAANHAAIQMRADNAFVKDRIVLLLGRRVAMAFGCPQGYFERWFIDEAEAYVLPHPSGVNRWWNMAANEERMQTFMKAIVERTRA